MSMAWGPARRRLAPEQVVAVELATALVAAAAVRPAWLAVAAPAALGLVLLAVGRIGGQWTYRWLALRLRLRRGLPAGAPPGALLRLVYPDAVVDTVEIDAAPAGVLVDPRGLTAVLELGDPTVLQAGASQLGPLDQPGATLRLVLAGVPAPLPHPGAAGTSYRQLTDGRVPALRRAFLAVRVPGGDAELASAVRRLHRRLRRDGVDSRILGPDRLPRVLAELAHHDPGYPVRERWSGLDAGGLRQATVRLPHVPELDLPCDAVTVAVDRDGVTVRLAARGPLQPALRRLSGARRLDGTQLAGLAATLPGGADAADLPPTAYSGGGLVLGVDRTGEPVTVRLFRPVPTRVALYGGLGAAQTVVLRALALGARVAVHTARPHDWEGYLRGVGPLDPPGTGPADPLRPHLVVVDGAPGVPPHDGPWQTTLLVRDEITTADADALARADLVLLQPLGPEAATLAGGALGLGGSAGWLSRIRPGMLAVVQPRRSLRWALLSPTPIERQLVGDRLP